MRNNDFDWPSFASIDASFISAQPDFTGPVGILEEEVERGFDQASLEHNPIRYTVIRKKELHRIYGSPFQLLVFIRQGLLDNIK